MCGVWCVCVCEWCVCGVCVWCVAVSLPLLALLLIGAHLSESAFNIPIPNSEGDHWELVQRGLATPFGSTVTESHSTSSPSPLIRCDFGEQEIKEAAQRNEGEGSGVVVEGGCTVWSGQQPEGRCDANAINDESGDRFSLMGGNEHPSGNSGDGSMETAVMKTFFSPAAGPMHIVDTRLNSAEELHADTDHICDMEDTPSTEEGEGEGEGEEEGEEEEYAPDGLDWSAEQSSDYSSAEDGSEGSEEKESEGEEKLVWKGGKEAGGMKIRQRKRLPKYLDDGDVSLYQARIR